MRRLFYVLTTKAPMGWRKNTRLCIYPARCERTFGGNPPFFREGACRNYCSILCLLRARGVVCFKYFYYLCSRFNIKVWNKAGRGLGYNPVAYVLPPHILHLKLDSSLGYMRPRMCNDSTQMYKDVKP